MGRRGGGGCLFYSFKLFLTTLAALRGRGGGVSTLCHYPIVIKFFAVLESELCKADYSNGAYEFMIFLSEF